MNRLSSSKGLDLTDKVIRLSLFIELINKSS
jgi:hypothetical protein